MSEFNFEKVYELLARPLDNRPVPTDPFGPMLVKVLLEEDGIFVLGTLQPDAMRAYFSSDEDAKHLAYLIERVLASRADNFCIVHVHECRQNGPGRDDRGIAICVHHKTGKRVGCLPIDADRVGHYAPMLAETVDFKAVAGDVKPLH